jgi:hypothetical protein
MAKGPVKLSAIWPSSVHLSFEKDASIDAPLWCIGCSLVCLAGSFASLASFALLASFASLALFASLARLPGWPLLPRMLCHCIEYWVLWDCLLIFDSSNSGLVNSNSGLPTFYFRFLTHPKLRI